MAQIGVREFDAKKMFFESIWKSYNGVQIKNISDIERLSNTVPYVVKPDMLFGKRGKLGLLGINLSKNEAKNWFLDHFEKNFVINNISWNLEVFLAEPFITHTDEYYISFSAERDADQINFSREWGIEVEENWDKVQTIRVSVLENLTEKHLEKFWKLDDKIVNTILDLWNFYKNFGFVYLEVNPFCFDENGEVILLDMVAKIDDQEAFRQKHNWKNLEFSDSFGTKENNAEKYIKKLDSETGASLKMKILQPNAKIWTLLAGGGGSLVITDTLGTLGYAENIGNYGELSGNPDRDFTREYTRTLFGEMLASTAENKYLIIAGAIANFTDVAKTFDGIIDILKEKQEEFRMQNIKILVRRGGINEKKWLEKLRKTCAELWIQSEIFGSDMYMTDILQKIK